MSDFSGSYTSFYCWYFGGGQDYIKALEEVKREGKRIVLVCFKSSFSAEIRQIADDSIFIDDISEMVKK